jgi:molecular chaperone DnaK (HSP70)
MTTTELKTIEKTVNPLVATATALAITSDADMPRATELLSQVNKALDQVTDEEDKVVKPLKEALKAEQGRWKPIKTTLEAARDAIRSAMSKYQTSVTLARAKEEERLAARVEKGTMRLDTAARKMTEAPVPVQAVETASGSIRFRTVQKLVITKAADIPREYLVPDEVAIKAALKAGKQVAGCELVDEQVPMNYR